MVSAASLAPSESAIDTMIHFRSDASLSRGSKSPYILNPARSNHAPSDDENSQLARYSCQEIVWPGCSIKRLVQSGAEHRTPKSPE
jgi:hypothetical protein